MEIIHSVDGLKTSLGWRRNVAQIGLLTIKGAVHEGHRALVKLARRTSNITVVYLHSTTPHNRSDDLRSLDELGIDFLFTPDPADALVPGEHSTRLILPPCASRLCAVEQPGMFDLDVHVTLKLVNAVRPQYLFFSDRDYQLATVLREVFRDLLIVTDIMITPAVRDAHGLAVSNRCRALTNDQHRKSAPILHQTLVDMSHALTSGARNFRSLEQTARMALRGGGFRTEYITVCDETTLQPPTSTAAKLRVFAAVHLGDTRLTDNIGVALP